MARKRRKRKQSGFLAAALKVLAVSVFAVFLGYAVGQVAIRLITEPLGIGSRAPNAKDAPSGAAADAASAGGQAAAPAPSPQPSPVAQPAPRSASRPAPQEDDEPVVPAMAAPRPSTMAPSDNAAATPTASQTGLWRVRVGRYTARADADQALAQVRLYVPEAFVVKDGVYRIQAGAFGARDKAEAQARELERHGLPAEVVAPSS